MRIRAVLLLTLVLAHMILWIAPAGAGEAEEAIADAIESGEVWVEEGSGVAEGELQDLHDQIAARGYNWGLAALAYEPMGGADAVAEDVLAILRGRGQPTDTVIVLALETVDGDSRMFSSAAVLDAVINSLDEFENNFVDGYEAIFDQLSGGLDADARQAELNAQEAETAATAAPIPGQEDRVEATTTVEADPSVADRSNGSNDDSSGAGRFGWFVGFGALGFTGLALFARRKKKKVAESGLEKLRAEVRGQVSLAASRIVELDDQDAILSEESQARFGEATATYHDVRAKVDGATTHQELDDLGERMDVALWQFDLTEAELKGAELPDKPEPRPDPEPPAPAQSAGETTIPTGQVPGGAYQSAGPPTRSGGAGSYGMGSGYSRRSGSGVGAGLGGLLGGVLGGLVRGGMAGSRRGATPRRGGSMGGYTSGQPRARTTRSRSGGFPSIPSSGRASSRRSSGGGRRTVGRRSGGSSGGKRSVGRRR